MWVEGNSLEKTSVGRALENFNRARGHRKC